MIWDALAPRPLFFRFAPAIIPSIPTPAEAHGWLWWAAVIVGIWFIVSLLFGLLVWRYVATWLGWEPTPLEEEAEALQEDEVRRFFKRNQKRNRKKPKGE